MAVVRIAAPLGIFAATVLAWTPLTCPQPQGPFASSCKSDALATDSALTLFFQLESQGNSGGFFNCTGTASGVTYCARNWTQPESGSAGSCFFLLVSDRWDGHGLARAAWLYTHSTIAAGW